MFRGPDVERKRVCQQRMELHWCSLSRNSQVLGSYLKFKVNLQSKFCPVLVGCRGRAESDSVQWWYEWAWEGISGMTSGVNKSSPPGEESPKEGRAHPGV